MYSAQADCTWPLYRIEWYEVAAKAVFSMKMDSGPRYVSSLDRLVTNQRWSLREVPM